MSELIVRRIRASLEKEFDGLIDLADLRGKPPEVQKKAFLTRSQAAALLVQVADLDKAAASSCVTDGFDDNGIDAIHYDADAGLVYVVQSKWVEAGEKSPDLGAMEKFTGGFRDYLGGRFDRFNVRFQSQKTSLESALLSTDVVFTLIVAYTGSQSLSSHATRALDDLLAEQNNPVSVVSYLAFGQKEIYDIVSGTLGAASINLDVTLQEWGYVSQPFGAYYGQVLTEDVARWYMDHGIRLTARNLRNFKGDTEVNSAMRDTLARDPGKFWYFNNGITILCKAVGKKPLGGSDRAMGHFTFEGVSVVNGAQTVGSIHAAVSAGFPRARQGKVLVRFISLENCPPGFGIEVTTATNTQNRIERRDFASLDPGQERIRNEMSLDLNKVYAYKTGERILPYQDGCDIEEATIALACAFPQVQLAAGAKRNVGMLWEDITKPPYTLLFNDMLTSSRVWSCVQVARIAEDVLSEARDADSAYEKRVAFHGNRFVLHRVFQMLPQQSFDDLDFDVGAIAGEVRQHTIDALAQAVDVIESQFADVYLNTFFKSGAKCETLNALLPDLPAVPRIPYFSRDKEELQLRMF